MSASDFKAFFATASGQNRQPYDYQSSLASLPCESRLISIPTGLGKTAAVILAWLWNRVHLPNSQWPRRLVYCLPMRTLVEQTAACCEEWLGNLGLSEKVGVYVLMGGEKKEDWDLYPESDAILIGTQDMLLSRALNRGYGMSRYRWPMHFGLLNNDCLWILDETQLMGVGVETSAQLDGFRHFAQWLRHGPCPTWWMSATLEDARLATVDHPAPAGGWPRLQLEDADHALPLVRQRLEAVKRLHRAPSVLSKQIKTEPYVRDLAKMILEKHVAGELTLVIINRVPRAQELYAALKKAGRKDNLALVHSRFRGPDRKTQQDILIEGKGDRIVIATQAVEAGVDVSARVLITELAPWSSLVQRFGRCNRGGEFNHEGADIHWIDLAYEDDKDTAPYLVSELKDARVEIEKLEGVSVGPEALKDIHVSPPKVIRPVIRKKDLIDLFDTTPDIAGHDLDISRYIRDGEDTDVQVFWRDLSATGFAPTDETAGPHRAELCRVAAHHFQAFLDKLKKLKDGRAAHVWDGVRDEWTTATRARAGAVYLLDRRAGGYDALLGWTGDIPALKKDAEWVVPLPPAKAPEMDSVPRDPLTETGTPLTLNTHTAHVVEQVQFILAKLSLSSELQSSLITAARWHDVGKALPDFQNLLRNAANADAPDGLLAKSGKLGRSRSLDWPAWRKYYRHELASALAWLAHNGGTESANLIAYLIAAHHGKVRLSIRAMPEEQPPAARATALMARGIVDGDILPAVTLDGVVMPETELHLGLMQMGSTDHDSPSWLARMITLRDQRGPYHLALMETLLRSADMRASAEETAVAKGSPQ